MRRSLHNGVILGVAAAWLVANPALAQKNPGPLLPPPSSGYAPPAAPYDQGPGGASAGLPQDSSRPAPVRPAIPRIPAPSPGVPVVVGPPGGYAPPPGQNPDVTRLAQTLPLDPQTRDLRDRVPTDPREIERRLGLREPTGSVVDLRGRTPSVTEIIDALRTR